MNARELRRSATRLAQRFTLLSAEVSLLDSVVGALTGQGNPIVALRSVLDATLDAAGVSMGALYLRDVDRALQLNFSVGFDDTSCEKLREWLARSYQLERMLKDDITLSLEGSGLSADARALLEAIGIESALLIPLVGDDQNLGLLVLGARRTDIGKREMLTIAKSIAGSIVLSLKLTAAVAHITESELRFRQLAENIRKVFFLTAFSDARVLYVNPAYEKVWGRSCESLYADPLSWTDSIHPDDRKSVLASVRPASNDSKFDLQYRIVRPDGAIRWIHARGWPVFGDSGANDRIAAIAEDVTELKQASDKLKESDRRLTLATRSAGIGVWAWNVEKNKLEWDQQMCGLYGIREQEFDGTYDAWRNRVHPDDMERAAAEIAAVLAGSNAYSTEFHIVRPDGEIREIEAHAIVERDAQGVTTALTGVNWDITERKRAQRELEQSKQRFSSMIATAMDAIVTVDEARQIVLFNSAAELMFGYSAVEARGNSLELLLPDRFRVEHASQVSRFADHGTTKRRMGAIGVVYGLRKNGEEFPVEVSLSRDRSDGQLTVTAIIRDISERTQQERKLARLSRVQVVTTGVTSAMLRLRNRVELMQEACRVCVRDGVFPMAWVIAIDTATQISEILAFDGCEPTLIDLVRTALDSEFAGELPSRRAARNACPVIVNDLARESALAPILGELTRFGVRSCAAFPLIVDRSVFAVMTFLASEKGFFDDQEVALLRFLTEDIAYALGSIENSRRLDHLAYFDSLTGLANARLFQDRLDQFVFAARQEAGKVCVIVIDLEHFTRINDSHGRIVGDKVLHAVSERLDELLVEPFTLSRISADTFAAASPRGGERIATVLRDNIFEAFEQPFHIDGHEIQVCVQAGIALFPDDGDDGERVFENAEGALKLAKSSRERFVYHSSEIRAQIARHIALEEQLRVALKEKQFALHYQPFVDMVSGEVVGAEVLIRWQRAEHGLVGPTEFIHFAEETGQIAPIGTWVIQQACAQQAEWIAAGIAAVPIAVNLSAKQIEKGSLDQIVRDTLKAHSLDAKYLELELTESTAMADLAKTGQVLQELHKLGVRLALDDFGTGYSSLAHVKRFPFDTVKIDRNFVVDITHNAGDAAIAAAIIAMAHCLGLKVTAEGVETKGQFNLLRRMGCDKLQGFYFSPAVGKEEFESILRSGKRMAVPSFELGEEQTLMVVDDEPGIRSALTRTLRRDGYHILTAGSGAEALEILAVNHVQVIISDQRMPVMSGTEFLNIVKQLYPDSIRIILSGYTDLAVVTDSVNRGAVYKFFTKPWNDELLREQVREAFQVHKPMTASR